jgi:hypothetical protein
MAGLDPAIHGTRPGRGRHNEGVDHRVKPGDDDLKRVEYHQVTNIAATATAIAPVDSHPMAQSGRGWMKGPITLRCIAITMIATINGTATTPLMTADQNNPLIGSRGTKLITTPINVAAVIAP